MKASRFLLLLILLLAAAIRLANLDNIPPPFNVDEAVNAYDAYSILKTGKDQWGTALPITIRAFNDFRRPATIYSAIPFIAILNLSIFAIRSMAAFWGWWSIIFIYRLSRDMFDQQIALFAVLLLALSPWHIAFSRLGVEVSGPLLTTILAALDFFWRWLGSKKDYWLIGSGVAFSLSFYSYTVAQAFTPLMLLTLTMVFWSQLRKKVQTGLITSLLIIFLVLPLLISITTNPLSWNRFDRISVLKPPYISSIPKFLIQWFGYFTPGYLFISGDANPIHHPPGSGQLLWVDAIFISIGVIAVVYSIGYYIMGDQISQITTRKFKLNPLSFRAGIIILLWVVLGSLPAALTKQDMGSANAMRGILSLPAWIILSAIGFDAIWRSAAKHNIIRRLFRLVTLLALLLNSYVVLQYYFDEYPKQHARAFEFGIKEAMNYVLEHEEEYTKIILTDWISQPHIFAVFFSRYDPDEFQKNHEKYGTELSVKLQAWGTKYETGDVEKLYYELEHGLFVARPHMLPDVDPVLIVPHPDGSMAFKIISK